MVTARDTHTELHIRLFSSQWVTPQLLSLLFILQSMEEARFCSMYGCLEPGPERTDVFSLACIIGKSNFPSPQTLLHVKVQTTKSRKVWPRMLVFKFSSETFSVVCGLFVCFFCAIYLFLQNFSFSNVSFSMLYFSVEVLSQCQILFFQHQN